MKSLYSPEAEQEVLTRLNTLSQQSARQWGKMEVDQMLAHCSAALEVAVGEKMPKRIFIGKILAPLFKSTVLGEKPFSKNGPTDKSFIITDRRDFEKEKTRLTGLIKQFSEGGAAKCTTHPHSFLGNITADEWGTLMYKHLDHHFRQFSA
jgi:hypothetical protein